MNRFNFNRPNLSAANVSKREIGAFTVGASVFGILSSFFGYLFGGRKTASKMGGRINDLEQDNESMSKDLKRYDQWLDLLEEKFPEVYNQLEELINKSDFEEQQEIFMQRTLEAMQTIAQADPEGAENPEEQKLVQEYAKGIISMFQAPEPQADPESESEPPIPSNPVAPTARRGKKTNHVAAAVTAAVAGGNNKQEAPKKESEPASI